MLCSGGETFSGDTADSLIHSTERHRLIYLALSGAICFSAGTMTVKNQEADWRRQRISKTSDALEIFWQRDKTFQGNTWTFSELMKLKLRFLVEINSFIFYLQCPQYNWAADFEGRWGLWKSRLEIIPAFVNELPRFCVRSGEEKICMRGFDNSTLPPHSHSVTPHWEMLIWYREGRQKARMQFSTLAFMPSRSAPNKNGTKRQESLILRGSV